MLDICLSSGYHVTGDTSYNAFDCFFSLCAQCCCCVPTSNGVGIAKRWGQRRSFVVT